MSQGLTVADRKRPRGHLRPEPPWASPGRTGSLETSETSGDFGPRPDPITIPQEVRAGGAREAMCRFPWDLELRWDFNQSLEMTLESDWELEVREVRTMAVGQDQAKGE